ncbi:MAG: ArgE/DapE family deacylase [Spirochaetaceae bacterium]|nr:ArgE/DapE family deacylase [Spirochaetaceae bacterium]
MGQKKNIRSIEEVKKLISIQSITGNEKELALYLEQRFKAIGCRTSLYEADHDRFNITAIIEADNTEKPGLLFYGHLDTVPEYNMVHPFHPKEIDGFILGRGSVDQKGGLAAVLSAFEACKESNIKLKKSVGFIGVIDEESEHRGSMALSDMKIEAEYAVVTEPTALKLGVGCKGTAPIKIEIKGRQAHGCRPWLGVNAILIGMEITRDLMSEELPEYNIEGVGRVKASWNLGKIEGGDAYNIVADRCNLWFDRRLVPGETQEQVREKVDRTIDKYRMRNAVIVNAEIARPDWNWEPIKKRGLLPALTESNSKIVEYMKKSHKKIEKQEPVVFFTDGYQEMDFLVNDYGIESIQYGPGDSSLCHTDNEKLSIADLTKCTDVYLELIHLICG